jgi:hypothetical protein
MAARSIGRTSGNKISKLRKGQRRVVGWRRDEKM